MNSAYEMIDRFLRNNLGDDDYTEFSAALDSVAAAGAAQAPKGDCNTCVYEMRSSGREPCSTCNRLADYADNDVAKEPT